MSSSWQHFQQYYRAFTLGAVDAPAATFALDLSRIGFGDVANAGATDFFADAKVFARLEKAFDAMAKTEDGKRVNTSEDRMVGHYWLRAPQLAKTAKITKAIEREIARIKKFAGKVLEGDIRGLRSEATEESNARSERFENVLFIGIGGSALGPQFLAEALAGTGGAAAGKGLAPFFFDNTDPDGMDIVLARLKGKLARTLVVVTSKSGGTKETSNGLAEVSAAFAGEGLGAVFPKHVVAITQAFEEHEGEKESTLKKIAEGRADIYGNDIAADEKRAFLATFYLWDWVGGRTSVTSAVGLLPAALLGFDIDALLAGAAAMDVVTRDYTLPAAAEFAAGKLPPNPAAQLALAWLFLTNGRGERDMVILPYKDRLLLFARYLQQLVMESLGKGTNGREPEKLKPLKHPQGIVVYGNKGATDQHAFVQQLREGVNNFFVNFIEVLRDREGESIEVDPTKPALKGVTSGDYLHGFFLGTREALTGNNRPNLTLTLDAVTPFSVGALIALFERAVGFYATLVGINAYDQPGVQAGKLAANDVLTLQQKILAALDAAPAGKTFSAVELAALAGKTEGDAELVFKIATHLAANNKVLATPQKTGSLDTVFARKG